MLGLFLRGRVPGVAGGSLIATEAADFRKDLFKFCCHCFCLGLGGGLQFGYRCLQRGLMSLGVFLELHNRLGGGHFRLGGLHLLHVILLFGQLLLNLEDILLVFLCGLKDFLLNGLQNPFFTFLDLGIQEILDRALRVRSVTLSLRGGRCLGFGD